MPAHVLTSRVVQGIFGVGDIGQVVKILPGLALAAAIMLISLSLADLIGRWILSRD